MAVWAIGGDLGGSISKNSEFFVTYLSRQLSYWISLPKAPAYATKPPHRGGRTCIRGAFNGGAISCSRIGISHFTPLNESKYKHDRQYLATCIEVRKHDPTTRGSISASRDING